MTDKKRKSGRVFFWLIILLVLVFAGGIGINKLQNTDFDDLSDLDREVISEYDKFIASGENLWKDYKLEDKDLIFVNKNAFGSAYLVTKSDISSVFAKEINFSKKKPYKVYRISRFYPKRITYIMGNFNTNGKTYRAFGKDNIFYIKYTDESISKKLTSKHFMPYLAHEAYHYYMQGAWNNLTFRGLSYDENELDLLDKEYQILDKIKDGIDKDISKDELLDLTRSYLDIMDERVKNTDRQKLESELFEETMEGVANYITIKTSKLVGYDYDIMYFENTKDVNFSDVVPTIRKGEISQDILGEKIVYESGALLTKLIERLEDDDTWQDEINRRGSKDLTLYAFIKENYGKWRI